ncbi:hypothetical protein [Kitasatospora sp. NPDC048407]|uniref:hypothetical protein n=1 Tax=Kitasatospora sp. NPDC048407 TaxID=3364051 RepID=UPI00371C08AC
MDEMPQGGAGGVPTPEQDREALREERRAKARTDAPEEQREDHRAEGRPPTVGHDWPSDQAEPVGVLHRRPRENYRAEGRPPTVTHDWPNDQAEPADKHGKRHKGAADR